jgi:NAD(P)-dependent dehydrogenase (short-subunit alcohol dehydrogenase family)
MDLNLTGRKALITGGSRGIGFAVAERFASEGVAVRIASRPGERLDKATAALRDAGADVEAFGLDLSDPARRAELVAACGDVDILVNNAGAIPSGTIDEISDKTWRETWELKVFGFIDLTRAYFERMKRKKSGVIINIIGAAGERPDYNFISGSAANAALMAMTQALGGTSPDFQVRVVGVNPGGVLTERTAEQGKRRALRLYGDESRWQERFPTMPFGRPQRPDQLSALVAFLASDLAYVSGTTVSADGGAIARNQSH